MSHHGNALTPLRSQAFVRKRIVFISKRPYSSVRPIGVFGSTIR